MATAQIMPGIPIPDQDAPDHNNQTIWILIKFRGQQIFQPVFNAALYGLMYF